MRTPIRYRWMIDPATTPAPGNGGDRGMVRWSPPIDVFETAEGYVIEADLPGITPERIELLFELGELVITGERPAPRGERVHVRERASGQFHRSIRLPAPVDGDRIEANFADGVLRVMVPKAEMARPRRISVAAEPAHA